MNTRYLTSVLITHSFFSLLSRNAVCTSIYSNNSEERFINFLIQIAMELFNSQQIKRLIRIATCPAKETTPSFVVGGLALVFSLIVHPLLPSNKT